VWGCDGFVLVIIGHYIIIKQVVTCTIRVWHFVHDRSVLWSHVVVV